MAKYDERIKADAGALADFLEDGILNSALSVELVDSSKTTVGNTHIYLYMFDKYYMRTSSRAALTLQVVGCGDDCHVTAMSAGGGTGSFLSFSWGAEENFVGTVEMLVSDFKQNN